MSPDARDPEVRVERIIRAAPSAVFEFFTSSAKWSSWQGKVTTIDPRVGGEYTMIAPNDGVARGTVVELTPPERIVFTWGWEGHPTVPPGSTTVVIELRASGNSTIVTLVHHGLPDGEIGLHRLGWEHYLGRLSAVAEGRDVGSDPGLAPS